MLALGSASAGELNTAHSAADEERKDNDGPHLVVTEGIHVFDFPELMAMADVVFFLQWYVGPLAWRGVGGRVGVWVSVGGTKGGDGEALVCSMRVSLFFERMRGILARFPRWSHQSRWPVISRA